MKSNGLKIKDLVTIGVFQIIYFVFMFGVGMIGIIPVLFLVYPTIIGIVSGPIIMLFMEKVKKPHALFIFGILSPLIMFVLGHTYVIFVHAIIVMFIAEVVRKIGNYKSIKYNIIAFSIYNTWICGSMMQMIWAKEKYIELCMMMGKEYVDTLERLITYSNMSLVYLGALIGGLIGGYIGKKFIEKHFSKAGIV